MGVSAAAVAVLSVSAWLVVRSARSGPADDGRGPAAPAVPAAPEDNSHPAPRHANRLISASSPYLLQHAHNPVDWYSWGEEALARAKAEDKPIFLSVGYSTCYWCHVMEREVFEDAEIAALMNALFINIKVDREQRPDLDEIYMTATQLMTRHGGWPNSVFLTPDLEPFYAGTYFGPTDQAGRPGFPTLIRSLSDAWRTRRPEVVATARRSAGTIRQVLQERRRADSRETPGTAIVDRAVTQLSQRYDPRQGGFGASPKFPNDFAYPLLFAVHRRTGNQATRDMALHSLHMMAAGGIRDHVGGGFHRYSTDAQWRVPHFEKMLYNQAQLTRAYVAAYETTGDQAFADVARDVLRHVAELMTGPEGQFYSALDAETDAVEGAYYAWSRPEIERALSGDDLGLFDRAFALGSIPTFPGHEHPDGGVLFMRKPVSDLARDMSLPYSELRTRLDALLRSLKARRDLRKLPRLDDKVIAGWNGLMIDGYAYAGSVLDDPSSIAAARRAADFVLARMLDTDGRLLRSWRGGVAEQEAFQEDYAFLIQGLLALHLATKEQRWLDQATELARLSDELFWDSGGGGYFFAQATPDLIARSKSIDDGAIPSGNSAMLHDLVGLWQATGHEAYQRRVEQMLQAFGGALAAAPSAQLHMVHALERWLRTGLASTPTPVPAAALPAIAPGAGRLPLLEDGGRHVSAGIVAEPRRVRPGETFRVLVDLTIETGWHINANPASAPSLIPTVVDLRGDAPLTVVSVSYPDGRMLTPGYAEHPIRVLDGTARIRLTARLDESAAPGRSLPIRAMIQYQACDDARCLQPTEVFQETTLEVVP